MLFSKDELESFLEDANERYKGASEGELKKLTRADFAAWLDELKAELAAQIAADAPLDPSQKDARKERAKEDFLYFAQTYFPHYFTINGVCDLHRDLAATFEAISQNPRGDKFAFAAPRGYGKTTFCTQLFPLWCVCYRKKRFIVAISDAVELVEGCLEAIKVELEDNSNLKADFPEVCGATKNWKIGEFVTANGVKLKAFGSGKRLRGVKFGVFRPDLAILDDLENDTNVRSRDQRDKLEAWLDEAVLNLGGVGGDFDALYIGTVLHSDSVLARKLKLKFWHGKRYRSIIDYPRRMDLWDEYARRYRESGDAGEYYARHKAQMDEGARVLWSEALNLETLMKKRAENLKSFNKEQQNEPREEAQIFTRENLHFYRELPKCDYFAMYIDPAGEKKKSDFTAITVLGVDKKEAKIYVAESLVRVQKPQKTIKEILRLAALYRVRICAIETNGGQEFFRQWIREKAFLEGVKLPLKGVNNTSSKGSRIEELEVPIDEGEILFHESQTLLIEQLLDYPEGKHDDAPDSLAGAYELTKRAKVKRRMH